MFSNLTRKRAKVRAKKLGEPLNYKVDNLIKCPACNHEMLQSELVLNDYKCPKCNHHYRLSAWERINLTFDTFKEFNIIKKVSNPLEFAGYEEKIKSIRKAKEINEAVVTGYATLEGFDVIAIVMDSHFLMGSMGVVVGQKVSKAFEIATRLKMPVILFSCSGGARMQEGLYSLMQMAHTSASVELFKEKGGLFLNVLTDPTTGGVLASFAMLGDLNIAEPNALIGFAGPRVIEQTIKEKLPEGFQRAEYVLECGFLDLIVDRSQMKETLQQLLVLHNIKR